MKKFIFEALKSLFFVNFLSFSRQADGFVNKSERQWKIVQCFEKFIYLKRKLMAFTQGLI